VKIELQNTQLSGQRPGRTVNCHEDDGAEILMVNVEVAWDSANLVCTLTVEHSSRKWPDGFPLYASGHSEQEAAEALVDIFLAAHGETPPA